MKKSILVVIGNLDIGGTEKYLTKTLPYLTNEFDITVYCITHRGVLADQLELSGIRVIAPNIFSKKNKLIFLIKKVQILKKLITLIYSCYLFYLTLIQKRPEIIHSYLPAATIFALLFSLPFKNIIKISSRRSLNLYQKDKPILSYLESLLLRTTQLVLANSSAIAEELIFENVRKSKIRVVYNYVDIPNYHDKSKRYNFDDITLLCVANFHKYKGHKLLFESFALLSENLPTLRLQLVGTGDQKYIDELLTFCKHLKILDRISFEGSQIDVKHYYHSADLFILLSEQEGFPNSIVEAMSYALPVISTNVGGIPEIILNDVTGKLIVNRCPSCVADAVKDLVKNDAKRYMLSNACYQWVKTNLSIDRTIKPIAEIYSSLIEKKYCPH